MFLFSCGLLPNDNSGFWAKNFKTDKYYNVNAELLYEGTHCNVWAEIGSGITSKQAENIANEYDEIIYQKMVSTFSIKDFYFNDLPFSNIMEFADWLGDRDDKLCILLLDIKDNYIKDKYNAYIAGYFWGGNLLNEYRSNYRDMIYLDTYPSITYVPLEETFNTLAHEMQHLMNFSTSIIERFYEEGVMLMDTWVDEGLSAAAEWVYSGHSKERINWFQNNGNSKGNEGLINKGNNFFVWDNRENESSYALLDDYATVYLFFQWLRLQTNISVYKDIISSEHYDFNAVLAAMINYSDWDALLKTWLAANYINDPYSQYGYKNDPDLKNIFVPAPNKIETSVKLAPGEGVYSKVSTEPNILGQGININNVYLTDIINNSFIPDSIMLTYNKNTNIFGRTEIGKTTGEPAGAIASFLSFGRSVLSETTFPYRIGAEDLLRQRTYNRKPIIINIE